MHCCEKAADASRICADELFGVSQRSRLESTRGTCIVLDLWQQSVDCILMSMVVILFVSLILLSYYLNVSPFPNMSSLRSFNRLCIRRSLAVLLGLWLTCIQAELVTLNDDTFEHQTQASTGATTGSWLLMMGTVNGCTSCSELKPLLEELSGDEQLYESGIVIGVVDVNESPNTAIRFGIETIPALLYLHKKQLYRFPSDVERTVESMKEFVLEHYSKVAAEPIPAPPSATDHIMDLWKKLQGSGMLFYAFAAMALMLLGTIGVLIMALVSGGSKKKTAKKD